MSEHESATFECEVSFDDAVVTWYKGTMELQESDKYSFRSEGRWHYMTIHNVTAEDEGMFLVKLTSTTATWRDNIGKQSNVVIIYLRIN